MEELAAKYAGAYSSDIELPYSPSSTEVESADDSNDETSSDEEEDTAAKHEEGMVYHIVLLWFLLEQLHDDYTMA